jgi:hypothetical protein
MSGAVLFSCNLCRFFLEYLLMKRITMKAFISVMALLVRLPQTGNPTVPTPPASLMTGNALQHFMLPFAGYEQASRLCRNWE